MSNLFVFTAARGDAAVHYKETIEKPVPLSRIEPCLTPAETEAVVNIFGGSPIYAWGARPVKKLVGTWNHLEPNDYILVYRTDVFTRIGQMGIKFRNRRLALDLWNTDSAGMTWEYIYLIKDIREINYSLESFKGDLGWKTFPQGFIQIPEWRYVGRFGDLKTYIDNKIIWPIHRQQLIEETAKAEAEEGARRKREVEFHERNTGLVAKKKIGSDYRCEVCGMSYEEVYGDIGSKYIVVHHLDPIGQRSEASKTTLEDLSLVCSNCHDMLHRREPPMSISELKEYLTEE